MSTLSTTVRQPETVGSAEAVSTMVATAHPEATAAALSILRDGGNAVDAALAAAWALSVVEPSGSGLGGQATMLIHRPGHGEVVVDGHSHGPASLSRKSVSRSEQRRGPKSCTVPSMPATLGAAHQQFGQLPLAATLAPSVRLAEEGFQVTRLLRRHVQWCRGALAANPAAAAIFLPKGRPPKVGSVLRQPALGATLRRLARAGVEDFYRGELAADIAADMAATHGLITADDLRSFDLPVIREAIGVDYRGYEVVSVPPPGGGLQILLALRLAEALELDRHRNDPIEWYAGLATIIHAVFQERVRWPLHPELVTSSMLRWLLSRERATEIANELARGKPPTVRSSEGPGDTTHLCVVDRSGMAVSLTQSIQSLFGAKVANEKLGFVYNNYLTTCPRYRHPSRLGPLAMPQSNAAPTMVFAHEGGRAPRLILGSAGSRRISSSIFEVLTNVIDRGMDLPAALDAPRIHVTLSRRPMLERRIASPAMEAALAARFRSSRIKADRSYAMGAVQAIARGENGWVGAADPRREGTADGF